MAKVSNQKHKLTAKYELISTCEFLNSINRKANDDELLQIYQGNFMPLFLQGRVSEKQCWSVLIQTEFYDKKGGSYEGTHEMQFTINQAVTLREMLDGAKNVKVTCPTTNIKTRWGGVRKEWLTEVDKDLAGKYADKAYVTLTCYSSVKPQNITNRLFNKLFGGGASYQT